MGNLSLFFRYLINMGAFRGLKTFVTIEILAPHRLFLSPYLHPIYLRAGTTDRNVFREVFLFQDYKLSLNQKPSVIVDGGANIGLSSVFLTNRFPDATIYAIEPDSSNFITLIENVKLYPNIKPVKSALWPTNTFLKIKNSNAHAWAFEVEESNKDVPEAFEAISIESFMKSNSLQRIDLLKLDVEGSEKEIFSSNYGYWLPRTKVIVVELHDWIKEGCSRSFFKAISEFRFHLSIHSGMLVVVNLDLE